MPSELELDSGSISLDERRFPLEDSLFSLDELSVVPLELSAELFAMMLEELLSSANVFSSSHVPVTSEQAKNVIEHARNKYLNWLITIPLFLILYLFYPLTEKVVSSGDKPD